MIKKSALLYLWYFLFGFIGVVCALYLSIYFEQIGRVYLAIDSFLVNAAGKIFMVPQWFTIVTYYIVYSIPALPLFVLSFLLPAPRKQLRENKNFILFSLFAYYLGIFVSSGIIFILVMRALRG